MGSNVTESFVREVQSCEAVVTESIVSGSTVADSIDVMSIFAMYFEGEILQSPLLRSILCEFSCFGVNIF